MRLKFHTLALALILLVIGSWSCQDTGKGYSGKVESITFAALPIGDAPLIYIAQDRGFFAANGLSVNIKDYATGVATIDVLLKGDVDVAWAAEFPFVRRAFVKEKISIIAVVSRFSDQYLFGRKDRGIEKVSDLRGKKIGVPRNTIAEFYLVRFLELNGMTVQNVTLVDIGGKEFGDVIISGKVDGVVAWEPYSSLIRAQLADRAMALPVQRSQAGYGVAIGRNDWIRRHPEVVNRFLKSLAQAEDYLVRNPEAAKTIVQKRMGLDDAPMQVFWSEIHPFLSLDQSLVAAMIDEARWMIKNNLTPEKQVPDFLNYIYLDGLKQIKPEAVNIIR